MNDRNTLGIIMAAGEGKRMGLSDINKTALKIGEKSLVTLGVEKLLDVCSQIVVVVGKNKDSVVAATENYKDKLTYVEQVNRLGTAHATSVAVKAMGVKINDFTDVIVGGGDHMYAYKPASFRDLILARIEKDVAISMVTTISENISAFGWGRIIRDSSGNVIEIVEQKNCTEDQLLIKEGNATLYDFEREFLVENIDRVQKNTLTGEYYLTDLVAIAVSLEKKVKALVLPFDEVGSGVNSQIDYENALKTYS